MHRDGSTPRLAVGTPKAKRPVLATLDDAVQDVRSSEHRGGFAEVAGRDRVADPSRRDRRASAHCRCERGDREAAARAKALKELQVALASAAERESRADDQPAHAQAVGERRPSEAIGAPGAQFGGERHDDDSVGAVLAEQFDTVAQAGEQRRAARGVDDAAGMRVERHRHSGHAFAGRRGARVAAGVGGRRGRRRNCRSSPPTAGVAFRLPGTHGAVPWGCQ